MSELEELIISKSSVKQDVYTVTKEVFVDLKEVLAGIASELEAFTARSDQRISIQLNAPSDFECQMTLAGDTTIFQMHTNVFMFPPSHMIHRSPYVMKEPKNGYCGVINVFNFLTDSFRYQRMDDSGYLIARIFINRERHFFVEGQQQLGYLFNDFNKAELTKKELKKGAKKGLRCHRAFIVFSSVQLVASGNEEAMHQIGPFGFGWNRKDTSNKNSDRRN